MEVFPHLQVKPVKSQENSTMFCDCIDTSTPFKVKPAEANSSLIDNFSVLCPAKFDRDLLIKESLLILHDRPCLNDNISSCPCFCLECLVFAPPQQRRAPYMRCFSELGAPFWNNVTNLERIWSLAAFSSCRKYHFSVL